MTSLIDDEPVPVPHPLVLRRLKNRRTKRQERRRRAKLAKSEKLHTSEPISKIPQVMKPARKPTGERAKRRKNGLQATSVHKVVSDCKTNYHKNKVESCSEQVDIPAAVPRDAVQDMETLHGLSTSLSVPSDRPLDLRQVLFKRRQTNSSTFSKIFNSTPEAGDESDDTDNELPSNGTSVDEPVSGQSASAQKKQLAVQSSQCTEPSSLTTDSTRPTDPLFLSSRTTSMPAPATSSDAFDLSFSEVEDAFFAKRLKPQPAFGVSDKVSSLSYMALEKHKSAYMAAGPESFELINEWISDEDIEQTIALPALPRDHTKLEALDEEVIAAGFRRKTHNAMPDLQTIRSRIGNLEDRLELLVHGGCTSSQAVRVLKDELRALNAKLYQAQTKKASARLGRRSGRA